MRCGKCGKEFDEGVICPFCKNTDGNTTEANAIPVLKDESDKRKLKKMDKIIIVIVAAVLVIAIIVAAAVISSKKKKGDVPNSSVPEISGEMTEEEEKSFAPVTADDDISVTFSDVSTDFAAEMEDFNLQTELTTAFKPELTTQFTQQTAAGNGNTPTQKPTKPSVTPEQHLEATTIKTNTPVQTSSNALKVISAFFNGKYYFDGSMITGSEKTPMEIAMNGSDFEVFSEMDGMDIAIMSLGGKIYLLNPDTKKYAEINSAVKKMMGLDEDAFDFSFNKIKFDPNSPTSVTEATYNGKKATCYTYKNDETQLEFIAVNDEIKQMTMFDKNGKADTVLVADEFTAEIPSNMLNFKGYSKTNIISFMSSMM